MKNIGKIELIFTYTNGDTDIRVISPESGRIHTEETDAVLDIKSWENGITEMAVTLQANQEKPLKFFDVEFFLSANIAGNELYLYNNGTISNDWVDTRRFADSNGLITRDVMTLKNTANGETFGIGYITADRFWSYLKLGGCSIKMRTSMENKPLRTGEIYRLERFIFAEAMEEKDFLEYYARKVADIYKIQLKKDTPAGWCSWSCFYKGVNQEKIENVCEQMIHYFKEKEINLVQIDDGWQQNSSFPADYVLDEEKFPDGLAPIAERLHQEGMEFGLWLAPTLLDYGSSFYDSMKGYTLKNSRRVHTVGNNKEVQTLDLAKPEVLNHIRGVFRRCCEEYKASYFKLDFLILSLRREGAVEDFVSYEEDYSVAVYRRALRAIREEVGEEAFMLACGAPMLESAGIFDGTRIGSDIIWGKNGNNPHFWTIVKHCITNVMLRYFYHNSVFLNDADGVVLRDFDNGDGFNASFSEVRSWATAVGFSGGLTLENDEVEKLSPVRRELFSQILPVYGEACKPLDFYEQPFPSVCSIKVDPETTLAAQFNYADKVMDMKLPLRRLGFDGDTIAIKGWQKEIAGIFQEELTEPKVTEHDVTVYLLKKLPETPCFLYADTNLFLGVDMAESSFDGKVLTIQTKEKLALCENRNLYIFVPAGYHCDLEPVYSQEKGMVVKLPQAEPGKRYQILFS